MITCEAYCSFGGLISVGDRPDRRRRGLSECWSSEEAEPTLLTIFVDDDDSSNVENPEKLEISKASLGDDDDNEDSRVQTGARG